MMRPVERQQDYVLRTVEERGIRFIQLWFTDVLGVPKALSITPAELENALEEGLTFDGSAVDGFSRVQESDVLARPDPTTFQILPLQSAGGPVAKVVCDILDLDGTPFEGDPRWVLRRTLGKAREKGFTFYAAPEIEYFYFGSDDPSKPPEPLDRGSYFELTVGDLTTDLRKRTVLTLEEMGIPVEYSQHEDSPGQHEIDLRHTDALTMADTVMTTRLVVKEIARSAGVYATFMPKPLAGVQGSGMHTHFSLFEGETNAFHDPDDEHGLSSVAKGFIAGLLRHAPELTAITNPTVNSYKRLVPGYEAPVFASWARNNASVIVNVPRSKRNRAESTRIEYRAPDPSCNPYLAYACVLAVGLAGIERGYELPAETTGNLFTRSPSELTADGLAAVPGNLHDAVATMESSELLKETLGDHVFEWFVRNKHAEWADYKTTVSQFELDRYFPRL